MGAIEREQLHMRLRQISRKESFSACKGNASARAYSNDTDLVSSNVSPSQQQAARETFLCFLVVVCFVLQQQTAGETLLGHDFVYVKIKG